MALVTFKRYENKYMIDVDKMEKLLVEIKKYMTPDPYCTDGRLYSIYNIYFDNDENSVIRSSLAKPYFKEKLRMRSYLRCPGPDDNVFIEIKRKIEKIVTKRRAVLTYADADAFLERGAYPASCSFMQRQVLDEISYFIKVYNVHPAVYICYDRYAYFGNDDKEFRLTFDSSIITRRDRLRFDYGAVGEQLLLPGQRLMEIKISGAIPYWLSNKMSELDIFRTSFSKYGREYETYISPSAADSPILVPSSALNNMKEVSAVHA